MNEPLLSVCLITYNHVKFIKEAINGILMQKVKFSWELIIADDCSTDGTRDIILQYKEKNPSLIKIIFQNNNVGAAQNWLDLVLTANSKYIAYLDGDDFWIDTYKLQKQIDYLENNPDYGLVHSDVNHLYENTGKIIYAFNKTNNISIPDGNIFNQLLKPNHHLIKSMTVCFRKDLLEKFYLSDDEIMKSNWKLTDISIWLMFSLQSKIHYFDEVFATYRLSDETTSRTKNYSKLHQFHLMIYDIRNFYIKKYGCPDEIKKEIEIRHNQMLLGDGFNLVDFKMTKRGIKNLKSLGVSLSLKDKAYYIGSYNRYLQKFIKLINLSIG